MFDHRRKIPFSAIGPAVPQQRASSVGDSQMDAKPTNLSAWLLGTTRFLGTDGPARRRLCPGSLRRRSAISSPPAAVCRWPNGRCDPPPPATDFPGPAYDGRGRPCTCRPLALHPSEPAVVNPQIHTRTGTFSDVHRGKNRFRRTTAQIVNSRTLPGRDSSSRSTFRAARVPITPRLAINFAA